MNRKPARKKRSPQKFLKEEMPRTRLKEKMKGMDETDVVPPQKRGKPIPIPTRAKPYLGPIKPVEVKPIPTEPPGTRDDTTGKKFVQQNGRTQNGNTRRRRT